MKLIARRPCSFGGKKFYIGDEIPAELVLNPIQQEQWGALERVEEEIVAPAAAEPAQKKASPKKSGKKPQEEAGEQ